MRIRLMSISLRRQPTDFPAKLGIHLGLRRGRAAIIAAVALVALLSATVAIGQASRDFDLACRGLFASGGRVITTTNFAVIGALGMPVVPPKDSATTPTYSVRSTNFAVRAGFLPAYPNGQVAAIAQEATSALQEQQSVQHLPIISKMVRIVRGGC